MDPEREESPMPLPAPPLLGHLVLVKRKTGEELQRYPIDSERVTFGRDYDLCDIRIYYADVSRLHAEIIFDLLTNRATLHVHGNNGLDHQPSGGQTTKYQPPSIIPLNEGDVFIIRKRHFRFEYAPAPVELASASVFTPSVASPISAASPAKASPAKVYPSLSSIPALSSPAKAVRRRASHRLSLVPAGKDFVPLSPIKSRRHSTLGLGPGATTHSTSEAAEAGMEEIVEGSEEDGSILEVVDGEDGETVYVEVTEEARAEMVHKPFHQNPFMTPQQVRKAAPRNTSAVPRTRKLPPPERELQPAAAPESQLESSDVVAPSSEDHEEAETNPADAPSTPRSVPLPPAGDTPYASTPQQRVSVPANVALSTPRGPVTLHKALLLRSARKAWEETRSPGIDGAVESGSVVTKRKSLSPKTKTPRKSLTPRPSMAIQDPESPVAEQEGDEAAYDEDEQVDDVEEEQGGIRWVHEDGTAEVSFEDSESDHDSLDADMSLDVPGEEVIDFGGSELVVGSRGEEEGETLVEDMPVDDDMEEEFINAQGDDDEDVDVEDEEHEQDEVEEDESAAGDFSHGTPVNVKALNRFYTPQVKRIGAQPRRSLASIGGPPMRLEPGTHTPLFTRNKTVPTGTRFPPTPGRLGPPSRPVAIAVSPRPGKAQKRQHVVQEDDEQEEDHEPEQEEVVSTPVRHKLDAVALAEAKKRRESLATPRHLPLPPSSGFKDPVRETQTRAVFLRTPNHPALSPTAESDGGGGGELDNSPTVARTPMDDIRSRLKDLRRQSVQRVATTATQAGRRATVGFALPATPARPPMTTSASYTVAKPGTRFMLPAPNTPAMLPIDEGMMSGISSLQQTPKDGNGNFASLSTPRAHEPARAVHGVKAPPAKSPAAMPATPSFAGFKNLFARPAAPPKTPYLGDIRRMFPVTEQGGAASPSLSGLKQMMQEPNAAPATPSFRGVKEMFVQPRLQPKTPGMEGLKEMYDLPQPEVEVTAAEASFEEEEEEIEWDKPTAAPYVPKQAGRLATTRKEAQQAQQAETSFDDIIVVSQPQVQPADRISQAPVHEQEEEVEEVEEADEVEVAVPPKTTRGARTTKAASSAAPAKKEAASRKKTPASKPREVEQPIVEIPVRESKSRARKAAGPSSSATVADEPEAEDPSSKPSRSRTAATRGKKAEATSSAPAPEEPKSRSSRNKRVLAEVNEQSKEDFTSEPFPGEEEDEEEEQPSKPSRSRKTTASASTTTKSTSASSRKKAVEAPAEEPKSAPSRRSKASSSTAKEGGNGGKENVAEVEEAEVTKPTTKRAAATRKKAVEPEVATTRAMPTRATRSRK